ncbi:MAG: purine-nucleoside phosphorylase, partial [Verrucomicrobiae bacterium]|nr:purine-nucleoside phosphorylase [Verrucomicrobiae bacterium]
LVGSEMCIRDSCRMDREITVSYARLPGFHVPTVEGHDGVLRVGLVAGRPVAVLSGRGHYYEGLEMDAVTYPIRVLAAWGIEVLVLTNAAGGINGKLKPGDFMLIDDHINFMGENPLRRTHGRMGLGFVDLSETYDVELRRFFRAAARECGVRIRSGVYIAVSGPTFETPAEIRAFARLGADAVGMSTVPEAIVARQCNLRVAAISVITNRAAGLGSTRVSHQDVSVVARRAQRGLERLITAFVRIVSSSGVS